MLRHILFFVGICCSISLIKAQAGGQTSYQFLRLAENARVSALGGMNVSTAGDRDPNLFLYNPALLADSMAGRLSFNYLPFYADVNKSSVTYVINSKKLGTLGFNLAGISYGTITERDIDGTSIGEFTPRGTAITVSKSHNIGLFTLGASIKLANSSIANYNSFALMADVGGVFKHPKRDFTIGLLFQNFGVPLKNYRKGTYTSTPIDIQIGTSYKLEHLPLKLSLTAHDLLRGDIQYLNPDFHTSFDSNGDRVPEEKSVSAQIFRHLTFSGEFIFGRGFHLRVGYNHQRRAEMLLKQTRTIAGFSFGGMMRIRAFEVNFTRSAYHVTGATTVLTITADINRIINRTKNKPSKRDNNS